MGLRYVTYSDIEKQKWDDCIDKAVNSLIYAKSFYLDAMADNWDAIVSDDYEAVMPLTWRKKLGIRYLYQPAFIQQGGIFFTKQPTPAICQEFIEEAFLTAKFAEITFNYANEFFDTKQLEVQQRKNYVLPLSEAYENINAAFSSGTRKNIQRAGRRNLRYQPSADYRSMIELFTKLYGRRFPHISTLDYARFANVCVNLQAKSNLLVRKVINHAGDLLAGVVMLKYGSRLYNVLSCVTIEGRNEEANYFLYSEFIKEFSNSSYLLDFEGSDVRGIADFYKGFTSQIEEYSFVKVNNLPPLLRLLKK